MDIVVVEIQPETPTTPSLLERNTVGLRLRSFS